MPVQKQQSDAVIGGTINQTGLLRIRATRVGNETGIIITSSSHHHLIIISLRTFLHQNANQIVFLSFNII